MRIIDLTLAIEQRMDVFPGLQRPVIECLATVAQDGYHLSRFTMVTHVGTHVDAPMHFIKGGMPVADLPLARLVGSAVLLDFSWKKTGEFIDVQDLARYDDQLRTGDIIVVNTGFHKQGNQCPGAIPVFPVLSPGAARMLSAKKPAAYATDALSVDPADSKDREIHHLLLGNDVPIVECLTNLDALVKERFFFVALPLKIEGAEGSPCRVVAIEDF